MASKLKKLIVLIPLLVPLLFSNPVQAEGMTLRHAINTVQQVYKGKVLKAYETRIKQETYYRVKLLLPSGRVISVLVNAGSGQIIKE